MMVEVVCSIEKVDYINSHSIKYQTTDNVSYEYFDLSWKLRVKKNKNQKDYIDDGDNYQVMYINFIIKLPLFDTKEGSFYSYVGYVSNID